MSDLTQIDLFDKVIDLTLTNVDGTVDRIVTPEPGQQGRKPTLRLKGELLPSNVLIQNELRVTNLYLSKPLSSYKKISVEAGYRRGRRLSFRGQVNVAFQELPGPDGITNFQFIVGFIDDWTSVTYNGTFEAGVSLRTVCQQIADMLHMTLSFSFPDTTLPTDVSWSGLVKDLLPHLESMFPAYDSDGNNIGLRFVPWGDILAVSRWDLGLTGEPVFQLDYVTVAKHTSFGYEIQAPWVPGVRPQSIVRIDPKYFRETFGGAFTPSSQSMFRVITMDMDFSTTDDTNYMSLVCVKTGSA